MEILYQYVATSSPPSLVDGLPHTTILTQSQFKDDLVRQGIEGGQKTAAMLKQALHEKLLSWDPDLPPHTEIVCRIYASFSGMGRTYKDAEVISDVAAFYDFVRGFNKADPTFDYVDAGNGKECADMKIKGKTRDQCMKWLTANR